jgi:hypothetical protein
MTFRVWVKDAKTQRPVVLAVVAGNDQLNGNGFTRGTDGEGYADVDMKDSAMATPITLTIQSPKYENWIGYFYISKDNQDVIAQLNPLFSEPSTDKVRTFRGSFGGIKIEELRYSINNTKILFTPGYVVESDQVRDRIRKQYFDEGLTHFPINLYNDSPIYHNFYPQWDDNLINMYLEELLSAGLVPVGSAFADNSKVVKQVVDPRLVPAAFTGWENSWPIIRPALDSDNLFWVARQYFGPECLIYWHNPAGQGAPYYNAIDWGYPPGTELNATVWNYIVNQSGCQGLLFQGKGWKEPNTNPPYDGVATSIDRLEDFRIRFGTGFHGWPKCDLVDFEETVYYCTTLNGDYETGMMWARQIREAVPDLTGWCNG